MTRRESSAGSRFSMICMRRLDGAVVSEGVMGGLPMTRILTAADLAALLTIDDCIAAVETAFRHFGEGRIAPPQTLGVHAERGTFHVKAAVADVFAAKINANFPENPARFGAPTIQGLIVVMNVDSGAPLGILDSTLITTLRTAAATAVAAKHLARESSQMMTIIGCGIQGRAHAEALLRVRAITKVFAFDADPAATERFAQHLGIEVVRDASIENAIAESDIVITCTT